jgi:hypothetical protein
MEVVKRFGRWVNFDSGIEYRFEREQASNEILKFYGDFDQRRNSVSWKSEIMSNLRYSLNLMSEDMPKNVEWESFEASVEGTKKLQKFLNKDLIDFLKEIGYFDDDEEQANNYDNYVLGCIIYHQLTYKSNLSCQFDG